MLVLARKESESIHIGDNIVVQIVSVENGVVKLGIDAPKNISIMRNELIEEVKESNKAASKKLEGTELEALSKYLFKEKK